MQLTNRKKKLLLCTVGFLAMPLSAQLGIGTFQPDRAAMLDVVSSDKGLLIPRVSLQSTTYILDSLVRTQPAGLLVYNEGDSIPEGFYFWNGEIWKNVESYVSVPPAISRLICQRATLEPSVLKAGKPYSGLLKIPYIGGNGGKYSIGSLIASSGNPGLQMRLKAGTLAYGLGELLYDVEGTPTFDSPAGATFPVEFMGYECRVTVGETQNATVTAVAAVGPLEKTSDNGYNGFHRVVTSPDSKFSVRVFIRNGGNLANADLQIQSHKDNVTIMWNGLVSYTGGTLGTSNNRLLLTSAGIWYGNSGNSGGDATTGANAAWGNEDVYYSAPEQRSYMWSTSDINDKTVYVLTFMMGAPTPNVPAGETTAKETKAFLQIEQIQAD
ncbi:MAG: hypothetical protein LBP25_03695 [Tannerellaceae bacterium]|nr:hypothetical protein [Tannerellaceae bacterium]